MMAGGFAYFEGALAAALGSYTVSSGHGGVPQHFVQNGGGAPSAGMAAVPDAGSGVYGGPASYAGYGSGSGVSAPMAMAAPTRPPPRVRANGALFKAAWTKEEDETLTQAVREHEHQHRKWAAVAQRLPGRTGKQCRERWVNHVNPTLMVKKIWTDEEDRELIAAHRSCGNRWSAIARQLRGRSENSVKNHWNATRRSLKAKRTLKKRNCAQPRPGQLSLLAEYIGSLYPTELPPAVSPLATPPTEPDDQNQQVGPDTTIAAAPLAYAAPAMYYHQNPPNVQHSWVPDLNVAASRYPCYLPPYPELNHHQPYGLPQTPVQMISTPDLQAMFAILDDMCPFADQQSNLPADQAEMDRGSSTNNQMGNAGGANGWCYYGAEGPGPNRSGSGGDDADVVHMASREFEAGEQYMATLDHLTRFN